MVQNMAGRRTRLLFLASCSNDSKPYSASFDFGRLRFRDTHSGIAYNAAADTRSSPSSKGWQVQVRQSVQHPTGASKLCGQFRGHLARRCDRRSNGHGRVRR